MSVRRTGRSGRRGPARSASRPPARAVGGRPPPPGRSPGAARGRDAASARCGRDADHGGRRRRRPAPRRGRRGRRTDARGRLRAEPPLTVVFVHGFALNLDCWHFQRAGLPRPGPRGLLRPALPRPLRPVRPTARHHRPARRTTCARVIDAVVAGRAGRAGRPLDGRHVASSRWPSSTPSCSATGSSASALISTTAGGLDPSRMLLPMLPAGLGGAFAHRARSRPWPAATGSSTALRRLGRPSRWSDRRVRLRRRRAGSYVEFVDEMLSATPFEVIARVLPELRRARQVPRGRGARPRCRPRSSAAPGQAHLDRPQPQAARADPRLAGWSSATAPATW